MSFKTLLAVVVLMAVAVLGLLAKLVKPFAPILAKVFEPWAMQIEGMTVCYGVVNTKSNQVTNADATPPVKTHNHISHGRLHETVGTVEIAAADSDGSVFRIARVHSSWRISEILRYNDAITSGAVYDVGLYDIAANGGAAVNADLFSSDISLTSASKTGVNDQFESADIDIDKIEKAVWELLALSADPGKWYDLCYTGDTVGSGAGTLSVRVRYVAND